MMNLQELQNEEIYNDILKEPVINFKTLRKYYGNEVIDIFEKGSSPLKRTKDLTSKELSIYLIMCGNCKAINDLANAKNY